ncbi:MAG: pyridoxal phosphate-dependent aminotransferase [Lachnospiraceae bacterium]|nr:pyridoxal phosphate-dependent aminotransferase [Lachnospiraceae bacterium]
MKMKYDFDRIIDRKQTNDMKWHSEAVSKFLPYEFPEDMIPMWLADTDFACAPIIVDALRNRADKEIFGYSAPMKSFYSAVCYWIKRQFGWEVQPSWISVLPTVVSGINVAIRAFTEEGDGVIIQQPVYDPFATIVQNTGRTVVNNGLLLRNGRYEMNFDELEKLASVPENKLLILCSPHNPVGRVWEKDELQHVADICIANNVMVITDEIHSDIVFNGKIHYPLLSLDKRYEDHFIHLTAPGKTFNVAGLRVSMAIIPNEKIRSEYEKMHTAMSLGGTNTFGIEAVIAAYTPEGHEWMEEELAYIQENVSFLESYVKEYMPGVTMVRPEGTFLCWLDLSGLHLGDKEIFQRVMFQAAVICVPGTWFGPGGEEHLRLNVGCPRSMLKEAIERIRSVLYE